MKTISNTFTVNTVIDGDDAAIAFATPSQISIPCYYTGYVKAQKVTSVTFSLKVGTNAATVTSVTSGTKPTGVAVTGVAANAVTITVGTSATASGLSTGVTFTVTGTYGGKTYSATVTVALIGSTQGEQGERGKVGRFFYFGGTFNAADTTQTFIVNDAQAPYFEHTVNNQKRYHVFNYGTNGTYTMAQMWAISSNWNNKPWESMTNDFKYIITEALFSSYAHLGSWIFNGDYMLSQTGVDGTENYTQFTGEGSTWQPNLYMNAKTGKLVANSGVIGGFTINASQIKSSNNNIILNSNGSATIGVFSVATNQTRVTGNLIVGSGSQQRTIEILPSTSWGAAVVGKNGNTEMFRLGFFNVTGGGYEPVLKLTDSATIPTEIKITNEKIEQNIVGIDDSPYSILQGLITQVGNQNIYGTKYAKGNGADTGGQIIFGMNGSNAYLRAIQGSNGDSAWPVCRLDPNGANWMDKGHVHVMTMAELKVLLENPNNTYYNHLKNYAVMLTRINGN